MYHLLMVCQIPLNTIFHTTNESSLVRCSRWPATAERGHCWHWEKLSHQEVTAATSVSPPTWPWTRRPETSLSLMATATPGSSSSLLTADTWQSGEQVRIWQMVSTNELLMFLHQSPMRKWGHFRPKGHRNCWFNGGYFSYFPSCRILTFSMDFCSRKIV